MICLDSRMLQSVYFVLVENVHDHDKFCSFPLETVQSLEYFLILCHLMVELYNKVVFVNISSCIILT